MKLSELIQDCGVLRVQGHPDVEISSVTNDSRRVQPGSLFIAVNGCGNDGRAYIGQAIEAGAAAIMYEEIPDHVGDDAPSVIPGLTRNLDGEASAVQCNNSAPAPDSGAEIGFSSNCTKNNFRPPVWKTPSAGCCGVAAVYSDLFRIFKD